MQFWSNSQDTLYSFVAYSPYTPFVSSSESGVKIPFNCSLNSEDVATFEYETKLRVFSTITPVDDRQATHEPIKKFISKMNL